jgi:putative NADPH-quinone reductase|tara:strand:- start:193 stop:768 length:576 start_codon:yes stop_codon:yes gene_type:complete
MSKTLILLFHRDIAKSNANAALAGAASSIEGVEIVDMQSLYGDGEIDMMTDGELEAQRLLSADRLVLQFPVQWYSTPALLKTWQDAVLTRMFYIMNAVEGAKFSGTPLMVAATAGNTPEAYSPSGQNFFTLDEILTPLKATAHRCGLPWNHPYIVYRADKLPVEDLKLAANGYREALQRFITATPIKKMAG